MRQSLKHQLYLIVLAIRNGFVALVPYLVAASVIKLLYFFATSVGLYPSTLPEWTVVANLHVLLPFLVVASIAYHLGRIQGIEPLISLILAISVYLAVNQVSEVVIGTGFASINTILCPIITTYLMRSILLLGLVKPPKYASLNHHIFTLYQYTPVFVISLLLGVLLVVGIDHLESHFAQMVMQYFNGQNFSLHTLLLLRSIFSPILFFFGIHGPNVLDLTFGSQYLTQEITTQINAKSFYDLFVIFGGSGACLALAIAILINGRDQHALNTTKVALPFLVFNISEVLVYGLPVIFNRILFLPFVLIPAINLIIAYWVVVDLGLFQFNGASIPWVTPIFVNAYMATNGDFLAIVFQACLLSLDVWIYFYFVKKYLTTQDSSGQFMRLSNALNLSLAFEAKQEIRFEKAQTHLIRSHKTTNAIVDLITHNKLTVYYQPKVDMRSQTCTEFEALIRLQLQDGQVITPDFLSNIESAGLGPVIDAWVFHQVSLDLATWQNNGFYPNISVNIHPDTLEDKTCLQKLKELLPISQVQLEFVERAFIDSPEVKANIESLSQHGFCVAVDDFGSGYSSLNHLNELPAKIIKLDKKLIDNTNTMRGRKMYRHIVSMCKDLGYITVAEGVESTEQLAIVMEANIDFVQGWHFAKAMPFEAVKRYSELFIRAPNNA